MASWGPPDGLPAGRLIVPDPQYAVGNPVTEPVLWITEDPPPEPGPLWARLFAQRPATGLWPLLLTTMVVPTMIGLRAEIQDVISRSSPPGRPWLTGELVPVPASQIRALDAGDLLAQRWNLAIGQGEEGLDFGEDAIPAVPFKSWPGLAGPGLPDSDPDARAAEIVTAADGAREVTGRDDPPHLGLVPAPDGAGAITTCGWMSQAGDPAEVASVVRSWQERFGARLCSLGMDTLGVSVAWPPVTIGHAQRVAAEHFAFCPDIADFTSFDKYAASLVGTAAWTFWWD